MMVGIDDIEEFKRVFLIFACATLLAPTSHLEGGRKVFGLRVFDVSTAMYVELTTPRIAVWNDFLVKQRIKLELEMLGGFGKVEQDEIEKNKAPVVDDPVDLDENEDFDVICARMETTQHEGQPSNCHEHVNESGAPFHTNNPQHSPIHFGGQRRSFEDDLGCTNEGVSERPNVEEGVFFANEDPLHPGPHNMLVLVQLCMDNNADVAPQAFDEIRPRRVKIKEETHVADYVFDESKDPRCHTWMYAILYMQYWDGSGLNRTINFERMCLERLKFATHMVLDSENEIGEMEFTNNLIEEDEFDADQKDAFKNFVKDNVQEAKKANRQAREARKKALQK
ncbi:hypothetical protein CK203_063396 [Vitis vinifera]|uniref:Uncharacterized protein n=1 Tax=Vitis vinifera TaxID=29760 RepID=A0A438G8X6_VITVI|nr:hypothetical protein CK203_063396 [Vitis vinifera]